MTETTTNLLKLVQTIEENKKELEDFKVFSSKEIDRLTTILKNNTIKLNMIGNGLDLDKINLVETFMKVGNFSKGGADRESVVSDAIKWFAMGTFNSRDLMKDYFATKNYDGWLGQREDHRYGYGPRHGYIVFSIGLSEDVRNGKRTLTDSEKEAAIYYLLNLVKIQEIQKGK